MLEGDDNEDGEDTEDCESLLVEVLGRQGEAVEKLNFSTFRDVNRDVVTSLDISDSDIVAAVAPRPASESEERTTMSKWTTAARYLKRRVL
ncbi:hypothetical protein MTO96_027714 [Rhipicephalus appendiculatus]